MDTHFRSLIMMQQPRNQWRDWNKINAFISASIQRRNVGALTPISQRDKRDIPWMSYQRMPSHPFLGYNILISSEWTFLGASLSELTIRARFLWFTPSIWGTNERYYCPKSKEPCTAITKRGPCSTIPNGADCTTWWSSWWEWSISLWVVLPESRSVEKLLEYKFVA